MPADTARLRTVLAEFDRLAVAVSGGVDSMTLAHLAHDVLGPRLTVHHAVSPAVPPEATSRVRSHAARQAWELRILDAGEFDDPDYLANPVDRCFFCKRDLYGAIRAVHDGPIASGTNLDDLGDFRPGLRAAARIGVRHPFVEAGFTKASVRALATELGLEDLAELPASPCLSSRLETGVPVTPGRLALVLAVERLVGDRVGVGTIRCRLRSGGLELQLEPRLLDGLDPPDRSRLEGEILALQERHRMVGPIEFTTYRRGSAFLHGEGSRGEGSSGERM